MANGNPLQAAKEAKLKLEVEAEMRDLDLKT